MNIVLKMIPPFRLWSRDPSRPDLGWVVEGFAQTVEKCELDAAKLAPNREWVILGNCIVPGGS